MRISRTGLRRNGVGPGCVFGKNISLLWEPISSTAASSHHELVFLGCPNRWSFPYLLTAYRVIQGVKEKPALANSLLTWQSVEVVDSCWFRLPPIEVSNAEISASFLSPILGSYCLYRLKLFPGPKRSEE
jgi:hypothetical protein